MAVRTIKSRLLDFADSTTCHGIGALVKSKSIRWRVLWALAILAAFSLLGYQIGTLWLKYQSKPISTKVEVKNEPLPFPSVTICNSNPYRRSEILGDDPDVQPLKKALQAYDEYEKQPDVRTEMRRKELPTHNPPMEEYLLPLPTRPRDAAAPDAGAPDKRHRKRRDNGTPLPVAPIPTESFLDYPFPTAKSEIMSVDYELIEVEKNKSHDRVLREAVQMEYHRVPQRATEQYGHQSVDMIQYCRFLGEDCSYRNFSRYVSQRYGNCWTFNSDELNKRGVMMSRSGTGYGLSLVINAEAYDYMPVLSSSFGVRAIIHPHGSFPFPTHRGYPIPVGYATDIGITVRKLDRLGEPYGDCRRGDRFTSTTGKRFDAFACRMECIHRHIKDRCGCYTYYRYDVKKFLPDLGVRKCTEDDDIRCTIGLWQDYARQKFDCKCQQPCKETEYLTTSALTQWPSAGFEQVLKDRQCKRELDLLNEGINNFTSVCDKITRKEFLKKNFLALTIYFKHLNYESIIQEPAYPLPNFLSDMGGTMGLYAGISLLTGIEIIALVCGLMKQVFKTCTGQREVKAKEMSAMMDV